MTLINGDKIITAYLYDDEHEGFAEEKMSIIDFVNAYSDEGVTTDDDVLDNIIAEIEIVTNGISFVDKNKVFEIIRKYTEGSDEKGIN